jgi:lipoyl(octanoyl) transferase
MQDRSSGLYAFRTVNAADEMTMPSPTSVLWRVSPQPVPYEKAVAEMDERVSDILEGRSGEEVWLLEHPPVYTAGTSAKAADLVDARFPVFHTGRGGQYTYHGPGQRVAYAMLDLKLRKPDVRAFVQDLEEWLIRALREFGVAGERRAGRVGIWVVRSADGVAREDKIAAIGVRMRKWITFHGISLNVAPDLSHYSGIVPCGVQGHGVTSLKELGVNASMADVDEALRRAFEDVFDTPTRVHATPRFA